MIACMIGIYLGISCITDLKRKEISLWLTAGFGLVGIILQLAVQRLPWIIWVGGVLTGVCLAGISRLTGEALGYGDCLVVMAVGAYLGLGATVELFVAALTLAAIFSAFILALRKADKKKRIPFLPFLFAAHTGISLMDWSKNI